MRSNSPYETAAHEYLRGGWNPLPLPNRRKHPPPTGWTGYAAPMASGADVQAWIEDATPGTNIGLRLPETVLGLDVDAYGNKAGRATMLEAIERLGPLPKTPRSSSRDGDFSSGIRFYRVPAGRRWADTLGPGVEVIHYGHRYGVVHPSVHPEGGVYHWYAPGGAVLTDPPAVKELPELPPTWAQELDRGSVDEVSAKLDMPDADVQRFLSAFPGREPCRYLERVLSEADEALKLDGRHDTTRNYALRVIRAGEQGHRGANTALDTLQGMFLSALRNGDKRTPDPGEWSRFVQGAVAIAAASPTSDLDKGCCGTEVTANASECKGFLNPDDSANRRIVLTPASAIHPRPVYWIWEGRIAQGTLSLLAGPEGVGKSTVAYWLAAQVTRGLLKGENFGIPRAVIVCATEDSWEHTIVPRLMAHGADLDMVYRVDVEDDGVHTDLSMPRDLHALEESSRSVGAAFMILDPLMSRLSGTLDTHKDGDVRRALEPLVAIADRVGMAILGVIHFNKSGGSDPLQLVMASKAFTAVARSVHTVIRDPDDESERQRMFGTPKNNLGRADLPTMTFAIGGHAIETAEGTAWTGRLLWGEDAEGTITDALRRSSSDPDERSATQEAGEWLVDYLTDVGGAASSIDIRREGGKSGHSNDALKRARRNFNVGVESSGFPRRTYWKLPQPDVRRCEKCDEPLHDLLAEGVTVHPTCG